MRYSLKILPMRYSLHTLLLFVIVFAPLPLATALALRRGTPFTVGRLCAFAFLVGVEIALFWYLNKRLGKIAQGRKFKLGHCPRWSDLGGLFAALV